MDSILTTIKRMLGITEDYTQFDEEIILHINAILSILTQIGVGPSTGFIINDSTKKWSDWLSNSPDLEIVKTYIFLRVKMLFDPPSSSTVSKSYEQLIEEFGSRLLILNDPDIIEEIEEEEVVI